MGIINTKASAHAKHARTGKDGAFYTVDGTLLATVESFQAQVSMNNAQYTVLGNPVELECLNTHAITISFTEAVIYDGKYIKLLNDFFKNGTPMNVTFQGTIVGNNKSQERFIYKNCIPSGQIDLQNVTVGDVIKRNWSFHCNSEPVLQKQLTI